MSLLGLCGACTSLLGISDPTPAMPGDGGPDSSIDSNIDAPPPCAPSITLKPELVSDIGVTGTAFAVSRFNNGIDEDIAIATGTSVVILHGNRTGSFGGDGAKPTFAAAATDLVIGDFDNDGDDDFAMWTKGGTAVVVRRLNRGLNPPVEAAEQPLSGPFTNVQRVLVGFLDGAFVPDLLVYDSAAGSRVYTSNVGTPGTFTRSNTLVGTGANELILLAQVDGAMREDALFVNGTNVELSLQTTSFGNPVNIATGANSKGVAVGKFDSDNLLDLVVSTSMGLVLYRQNPAAPGTFQMHGMISPVQSPTPMLVGDVNDDGRDDIIVANAAILQCPATAPGGPGVFTQVEQLSAAPPSALVDVTGDDKPDLVRIDGTTVKVRPR